MFSQLSRFLIFRIILVQILLIYSQLALFSSSTFLVYFSDHHVDVELECLKLLERLETFRDFGDQVAEFVDLLTPDRERFIRILKMVNLDIMQVLNAAFGVELLVKPAESVLGDLLLNSSIMEVQVLFMKPPEGGNYSLAKAVTALHKSGVFGSLRCTYQAGLQAIRGIHKKTGMKLAIYFDTRASVRSRKIVEAFLSVSENLRTAMLVLQYWAQIHKITDFERGISNYSLVMMFIFYLQKCYGFPSISQLQTGPFSSSPGCKWNWSCGTIVDSRLMLNIYVGTVLQLLVGFFDFYNRFNFTSNIICPYLGREIPKNRFAQFIVVEQLFGWHKEHLDDIAMMGLDSSICIQDPIELDRILCNVDSTSLMHFKLHCIIAKEILIKRRSQLVPLFAPIQNTSSSSSIRLHLTHSKVNHIMENLNIQGRSEVVKTWHQQTRDFCLETFSKVFGFLLEEVHRGPSQDVYQVVGLRYSWICHTAAVQAMEQALTTCLSTFERERVMLQVLQESYRSWSVEKNIDLQLVLRYEVDPAVVVVEILPMVMHEENFEKISYCVFKNLIKWFYENERYVEEQPIYSKLI